MRAALTLLFAAAAEAGLGVNNAKYQWLKLTNQLAPPVQIVDLAQKYTAYNLSIAIDHFHNETKYEPHTDAKFNLRYWFDASYYKPGGPVIVFESGESDAETRLPILQMGIVAELAQATNGIGVILEHRYYGTSQPYPDFSTEHLRFLTTEQALADTAYFAQNVVFAGLEDKNLTSYTTPWIAYGGSYSGAFVAMLRKLYPDTFFAAISSSGVTEAIVDYWAYYEPIRKYGPAQGIKNLQYMTNAMDNLLTLNKSSAAAIKTAFGMATISYPDDFMNIVSAAVDEWQELNWDPAISYRGALQFLHLIGNQTLKYPKEQKQASTIKSLLTAGGYGNMTDLLTIPMLNYIGWTKEQIVKPCTSANQTLDQCYGSHNPALYKAIGLDQYRNWPYQVCTQWGYFLTGSGVPAGQLPLVSRLLTVEYLSLSCKYSYNITTPPDVNLTNSLGGYSFTYPRLAFIDGQWDPWREATVHSEFAPKGRVSTASQPFYEIDKSIHHWDENGVFANKTTATFPPPRIQKIQKLEVQWVKAWLEEAKGQFPMM